MINYDPKIMKCHECIYYMGLRDASAATKGHCRRFPPVPVMDDGRIRSATPKVDPLNTCGEWRHA